MSTSRPEDLAGLKAERDALTARLSRERTLLTQEQKVAFLDRVAEIDVMASALEYARMDPGERISYWTLAIHRSMRSCGEQGGDEIASLDKQLLLWLRERDPEIDKMMPAVLVNLARLWSIGPKDLLKRVETQMAARFR